MKKIVLSFAVLAALTSASFASQRSYDPERTLNGKALNSLIAKQSTLLGGPAVSGFSAGRLPALLPSTRTPVTHYAPSTA